MLKGIFFLLISGLLMGTIRPMLLPSEYENKSEFFIRFWISIAIGIISIVLAINLGFPWWYCLIVTGLSIFMTLGGRPARMSRYADTLGGILFFGSIIIGIYLNL